MLFATSGTRLTTMTLNTQRSTSCRHYYACTVCHVLRKSERKQHICIDLFPVRYIYLFANRIKCQ